jgi:hypothetical protein
MAAFDECLFFHYEWFKGFWLSNLSLLFLITLGGYIQHRVFMIGNFASVII